MKPAKKRDQIFWENGYVPVFALSNIIKSFLKKQTCAQDFFIQARYLSIFDQITGTYP
jgi:hypothetical protein